MAVQCKEKVESYAGKNLEVVKELLLERDCGGPAYGATRTYEGTSDEFVKLMV